MFVFSHEALPSALIGPCWTGHPVVTPWRDRARKTGCCFVRCLTRQLGLAPETPSLVRRCPGPASQLARPAAVRGSTTHS